MVVYRSPLGSAARTPGDVDWVVRSSSISLNDAATAQFFDWLIENVSHKPRAGSAKIEVIKLR